ncbi:unnamed protein product [Leptidea sinapis]|uniref:Uncharacterized protein n=1 Tax=Leptidea sinapis TaxID=189913 RepID=A0A5E4PXZ4_9NEOP|nr:unnamed protein product [Leptidea sinapis]
MIDVGKSGVMRREPTSSVELQLHESFGGAVRPRPPHRLIRFISLKPDTSRFKSPRCTGIADVYNIVTNVTNYTSELCGPGTQQYYVQRYDPTSGNKILLGHYPIIEMQRLSSSRVSDGEGEKRMSPVDIFCFNDKMYIPTPTTLIYITLMASRGILRISLNMLDSGQKTTQNKYVLCVDA